MSNVEESVLMALNNLNERVDKLEKENESLKKHIQDIGSWYMGEDSGALEAIYDQLKQWAEGT